jgi:hypothetical protein
MNSEGGKMSQGERGRPGEPPIGQQGGKGGEGGKGGAGQPEGEGGRGGAGGRGATGERGPQGNPGSRGEPGKYEAIHPYRWIAITVWIAVFTVIVIWGLLVANSSREALCNQRKDLDSRIARTEAILNPATSEERIQSKAILKLLPKPIVQQQQNINLASRENLDRLDSAWYIPDCADSVSP